MILGKPYLSSFLPLKDAQGALAGVVAASRPEVELTKAAIAANRLTLLSTLVVVFALLLPGYFVLRRITMAA